VLALMELWNVAYSDIMSIPWSRRKRLCSEKDELETRRQRMREDHTKRARRRR
jgi:hypothetical protein